ncbi:MAG: hypothetical protein M3Y07_04590 [Acidobacteriota bacterium]|nr:hypothetical protein [Acidobacteriota bacterium]
MRCIALALAGFLWLAPVEARKPRTPKSNGAAAHKSVTPRAKHLKIKKFKPTGRAKAKRYSKSKVARQHS